MLRRTYRERTYRREDGVMEEWNREYVKESEGIGGRWDGR